MNLKKKLLTLIICSFIVIFTASCSCGGDTEEVKTNTTVATQAETDEQGEVATNSQADGQQTGKTVNDDKNADAEKADTDSQSETSSDNSKNKADDSDDNNSKSEKTNETNTANSDSDSDKTEDEGEEALYNAEAVFDEDDFEF